MPELPEVETVVRYVRPALLGKKITSAYSNTPRLFRHGVSFAAFKKSITNKKIKDIKRIGKYIQFQLSDGNYFSIHLMMTGQLLINPADEKNSHTRFWMECSDGTILQFRDIRKFGMITFAPNLQHVGPDALSISAASLYERAKNRQVPIKSLLLNQSILAGVGNIYADEALWFAGIHPLRKANSLDQKAYQALHGAIQKVLQLAIKSEGSSSRNYRKPNGEEGGYYAIRKAYHRTDEPCAKDGAKIQRMVVGQRRSHFCPKHQI